MRRYYMVIAEGPQPPNKTVAYRCHSGARADPATPSSNGQGRLLDDDAMPSNAPRKLGWLPGLLRRHHATPHLLSRCSLGSRGSTSPATRACTRMGGHMSTH